jgi:hypothetical protein
MCVVAKEKYWPICNFKNLAVLGVKNSIFRQFLLIFLKLVSFLVRFFRKKKTIVMRMRTRRKKTRRSQSSNDLVTTLDGTRQVSGSRMTRGPFLTSPLGANFDPQLSHGGELCPLVAKLSLRTLSPRGEDISSPLHSSKQYVECSPLGAKFTPRSQVHPWEQTMLLKIGL